MGATYRKRGTSSWLVTVHHQGQKEFKTVHAEQDARGLVKQIHKQELAGINVIDTIRAARTVAPKPEPITYPTLRAALLGFLDRAVDLHDIRDSTARSYRLRCARWLFPHPVGARVLGDIPIDRVTREHVGAVITRIRAAGKSRATLEHVRMPVRTMYADLIERKAFPGPNPAADLKFFVGKATTHDKAIDTDEYFAREEIPQLLATANAAQPLWYAFIATSVLAGLRWGEVAALQKADIDFTKKQIRVARTLSGTRRHVTPPKNHRTRFVTMTPALARILRDRIEQVTLDGALHEDWTAEQRNWLFLSSRGQLRVHAPFIQVWKTLLKKAGLPYRRFHACRHTFATSHLENGADPRWVQAQMGHSSISQTVDTYGHLMPDRHAGSAEKLDAFLGLNGEGLKGLTGSERIR